MALHNLVKEAMIEVRQRPELPRGDDEYIEVQLLDLIDDDDFWAHQSHGLGVITTPDGQWTFRLPHRPNAQVHVDDKANLIQLIAATTAQDAHVLCLSEGEVRLIDVAADLPPKEVKVAGMPSDAASAAGKSSLKDRSPSGRLVGSEGKRVRIRQFARLVDDALMPILRGDERPLILIATEPIYSIFRQVCSAPTLAATGVEANADFAARVVRPRKPPHFHFLFHVRSRSCSGKASFWTSCSMKSAEATRANQSVWKGGEGRVRLHARTGRSSGQERRRSRVGARRRGQKEARAQKGSSSQIRTRRALARAHARRAHSPRGAQCAHVRPR